MHSQEPVLVCCFSSTRCCWCLGVYVDCDVCVFSQLKRDK